MVGNNNPDLTLLREPDANPRKASPQTVHPEPETPRRLTETARPTTAVGLLGPVARKDAHQCLTYLMCATPAVCTSPKRRVPL